MTETPTDLLDTDQAARYLHLSPTTLKIYRSQGKGPKWLRANNGASSK